MHRAVTDAAKVSHDHAVYLSGSLLLDPGLKNAIRDCGPHCCEVKLQPSSQAMRAIRM